MTNPVENNENKRRHTENTTPSDAKIDIILNEILGMKNVVNDLKIGMTKIQEDNQQWKTKVQAIETDLKDVKESVNMAHDLITDETMNRKQEIGALKADIIEQTREMSNNAQVLNTHSTDLRNIKSELGRVDTKLNNIEQEKIQSPLKIMKAQLDATLEPGTFPVKTTLVAQNVWNSEGENLEEKASLIIHKALNLPQIATKRVEHKSGWKTGSGLVKIELHSQEDLKRVLGRKKELKQSTIDEINRIFLRQSKREEVLLMEKNLDLVLQDMGVRNEYVWLSSGHLVCKENFGQ